METLGSKIHATLTVILAVAVVALATYGATVRSANITQAQVLEARFKSIIYHIEREGDLEREVASLKAKLGSAQGSMGSSEPAGSVWDTVVEGKNAVAIITGLLLVDKAANSQDRHAKTIAVMDSVADKTDSRLVELLAAHVKQPNTITLQALLDFALSKK